MGMCFATCFTMIFTGRAYSTWPHGSGSWWYPAKVSRMQTVPKMRTKSVGKYIVDAMICVGTRRRVRTGATCAETLSAAAARAAGGKGGGQRAAGSGCSDDYSETRYA